MSKRSALNSAAKAALPAVIESTLTSGARAVLVSQDDGNFIIEPLVDGESVLRLEHDLISHLDSRPWSDEWLTRLRDYAIDRLEKRNRTVSPNVFGGK